MKKLYVWLLSQIIRVVVAFLYRKDKFCSPPRIESETVFTLYYEISTKFPNEPVPNQTFQDKRIVAQIYTLIIVLQLCFKQENEIPG